MPSLPEEFDRWRNRLLDISQRNPLIHYRPARVSSLRITSPSPDDLFPSLAAGKKLFLPRIVRLAERGGQSITPEDGDAAPLPALPLEPATNAGNARAAADTPGTIRYAFEGGDLEVWPRVGNQYPGDEPQRPPAESERARLAESALRNLSTKAHLAVEEKGFNVLYLALGFLRWRDPNSAEDRPTVSPLVLVPAQLDRESPRDPYQLSMFDDDILLNPALQYQLQADFSIDISAELLTEAFDTLPEILDHVAARTRGLNGFEVVHDAWLGLFQFAKLVMYRDLGEYAKADATRGETPAWDHPIASALLGDGAALRRDASTFEPVPNPSELDRVVRYSESYIVEDSDSSQMAAIEGVKRGHSMVIHGPPGTGKSQTIANLIAESLATGKTVLFVSEKMAALEVVHRRLNQAGLGEFCLEAHSHRASKQAVLDQLRRSVNLAEQARELARSRDDPLRQVEQRRAKLANYAAAIHSPSGMDKLTPFSQFGEVAKLRDNGIPEITSAFPPVVGPPPETLDRYRGLVARSNGCVNVWLEHDHHPWAGLRDADESAGTEATGSPNWPDRLAQLRQSLTELRSCSQALAALCGLTAPAGMDDVRHAENVAAPLLKNPGCKESWLTTADLAQTMQLAKDRAELTRRREASMTKLQEHGVDPEAALVGALERGEKLERAMSLLRGARLWRGHGRFDPALDDLTQRLGLIEDAFDAISIVMPELLDAGQRANAILGLPTLRTRQDLERLLEILTIFERRPYLGGSWLEPNGLGQAVELAASAKDRCQRLLELEGTLLVDFDTRVLDAATPELMERLNTAYATLWGRLWPGAGYAAVRRRIEACKKLPAGRLSHSQVLRAVRDALDYKDARAWMESHESQLAQSIGARYRGRTTDWSAVLDDASAVNKLLDHGVPPSAIDALCSGDRSGVHQLADLRMRLVELRQRMYGELKTLSSWAAEALPRLEEPSAGLVQAGTLVAKLAAETVDYRAVVRNVAALREPATVLTLAEVRAMVQLSSSASTDIALERAAEHDLREAFGPYYSFGQTNWTALRTRIDWAASFRKRFPGNVPPPSAIAVAVAGVADLDRLESLVSEVAGARSLLDEKLAGLRSAFLPDSPAIRELTSASAFRALESWLAARATRVAELDDWLRHRRLMQEWESAGLGGFAKAAWAAQLVPEQLPGALELRWRLRWLEEITAANDALSNFAHESHTKLIQEFRRGDQETLRWNRARVQVEALKRLPEVTSSVSSSPATILRRELAKQKRHRPVRRLFEDAGELIQLLRPCFMMSPISLAQYLRPRSLRFDLVIFDEASQIFPWDALGAVLRGDQIVLAGDQQQLPPTDFFAHTVEDLDEEEDEDFYDRVTPDQSLLDLGVGGPFSQAHLRWHYRSRCEQLIAFSNRHFYDDELVTFPMPTQPSSARCVAFHHVDGLYEGRGRNRREAQYAAELILRHAREKPEDSLGVVTFSESQREEVMLALDEKRRDADTAELDEFFKADRQEPFFVKNLENVQGDERDYMLFSVGYGPDRQGQVSHNFGPLTHVQGHRRLNVAITRARKGVHVVSSMRVSEIDPARSANRGPQLLRAYLDYAERGFTALTAPGPVVSQIAMQEMESPLEESVYKALTAKELVLHPQVGASRYRVDFGVVHPDHPGRYILGIECDGQTYHRLHSVRDRDRIRQAVLEDRGWVIERIWSPDWHKFSARVVERILERVRKLREAQSNGNDSPVLAYPETLGSTLPTIAPLDLSAISQQAISASGTPQDLQQSQDPGSGGLNPECYIDAPSPLIRLHTYDDFQQASRAEIAKRVEHVITLESPVHVDEVVWRASGYYGIRRAGAGVREKIESGIDAALRRRSVVRRRRFFLWAGDMTIPKVRGKRPDGSVRKVEHVAPEEIREAVSTALRWHLRLNEDDLSREAARLLGYDRRSESISTAIENGIRSLRNSGEVIQRDDGMLNLSG